MCGCVCLCMYILCMYLLSTYRSLNQNYKKNYNTNRINLCLLMLICLSFTPTNNFMMILLVYVRMN